MRLTDSVSRELKLFRGRKCVLRGWAPHPEEEKLEVDGEWVLTKMPKVLYLEFANATWQVHSDLEPGVYPLTQVSRTWLLDKKTKVKARRTGFFAVPDFSSTAHMIQGHSLEAAFAQLVSSNIMETPTDELQQNGYVMLSRAKYPERMWVLQAFARQLFARGEPPGPSILMRKLRGELKPEDIKDAFITELERKKKLGGEQYKDFLKIQYRCTHCFLSGRTDFMKFPRAFGVYVAKDMLDQIFADGAWTRCLPCRELADALRVERQELEVYTSDASRVKARMQGDEDGMLCSKCDTKRPLEYYSATSIHHRSRDKNHICVVCTCLTHCEVCRIVFARPINAPSSRCKECRYVPCVACGNEKHARDFDATSVNNFFSHSQNVVCIVCAASGATPSSG